jgi:hypothetical protein
MWNCIANVIERICIHVQHRMKTKDLIEIRNIFLSYSQVRSEIMCLSKYLSLKDVEIDCNYILYFLNLLYYT